MLVASAWQGFALHLFLASLLVSSHCLAKLVNTTIDDGYGDPRTGAQIDYSPPSAWLDGRVECPGCTAKPNTALLYNRTWHDSTFVGTDNPNPSNWRGVPTVATVHFSGVGVYVYCVIGRPNDPGFATRSDMTFYIDGKEMGTYIKEPPGGDGYDYDVLVFKTDIPPGEHEFILQNGRPGGLQSLVLLDRIVYTYDDGESRSSKTNIGAIVGGVLGSIVILALAVTGTMMWVSRRRRRRQSAKNAEKANPYPILLPEHHHHHTRGAPSVSSNSKNTYQGIEGASVGAGSSDTGSGIHPLPQTFNRFTRLPGYEEIPPPPPAPPPSITAIPTRQVKFGAEA